MLERLRERQEWQLARALWRADRRLATGVVGDPRAARRAAGGLRGRDGRAGRRGRAGDAARRAAGRDGRRLRRCSRCSRPIHQAVGANLGDRTAAWLYDGLTDACVAPPGMGHLEDPELASDLTVARDFDLGMTGPPLSISMDFIAGGLVELVAGLASAAVLARATRGGRRSCSAARGWPPTGCCARARSGATATPTRCAARSATPTTPTASPSTRRPPRSCGCSASPAGRSTASSPGAPASTDCSTRPPGCASGRCSSSLVLVVAANVAVFWSLADAAADGRIDLGRTVDLRAGRRRRVADRVRRAQLGARRRRRRRCGRRAGSSRRWARRARSSPGHRSPPTGLPAARDPLPRRHLRLPGGARRRGARRLRPHDPGRHVAGHRRPERRRQDHARQAALPALRPAGRRHRGRRHRPARPRPRRAGASASPRCSRTSSASSCRCATTWRPAGAPDDVDPRRARARPAPPTSPTSTRRSPRATRAAPTCPAASGSASRWPGRCARCSSAPGVVLLDEPTAQLDVRGEAEIFERVLAATAALHDDPHLAPLLHRAPGRPHLRARARPRGRARHPRRADGARRPLPHDVRPAGAALRRRGDEEGVTLDVLG